MNTAKNKEDFIKGLSDDREELLELLEMNDDEFLSFISNGDL